VSIQLAPARDFWPLESRHRHFPNPSPKLQNSLQKNLNKKKQKKIIE